MAEQDIPPPTITAMKIPIIKKGEYDIWSMRMRQYICHTDHNLWDVIVNGDLEEEPAPTGETSAPPTLKTAKQLAAKRNQDRVKSILLLAIPDEYLLKFHNVTDAKSLWETIKSRFRGNEESKKMQKNVLKHQFGIFSTASNESLDKAYDRFQKLISQLEVHGAPISKENINLKFLKSLPLSWNQISLIMRNKPDIDEIDIDDLYNNLRVYEDEMKRSLSSTSTSQNLAFLFSENTSSTNEVSTASGDFKQHVLKDLVVAACLDYMLLDIGLDVPTASFSLFLLGSLISQLVLEPRGSDLGLLSSQAASEGSRHFTNLTSKHMDWFTAGYGESNAPTNESSSQALVAQDGLVSYDWSNDFEVEPVNYALMAISSSSSSSVLHDYEKVVKERDELKLKIEKWEESSKNLDELLNSQMSARDKTGLGYGTQLNEMSNNSETNRNFLTPRADISFAGKTNEANTQKPKTIYESVNRDKVIIEDWNSDDEDDVSEVQTVSPVKTNETQTVKTRVDKIGVLTRTGLITLVKQNEKRSVHIVSTARPVSTDRPVSIARLVSTARPVSTVRPFAPKIANTGSAIRTIYPRMDNVRPRGSYSPIKRSYYTKPAFRPKDLKQDVKTFRVKNMTTTGTRVVVHTGKGNPEIFLQDHAVVDSGCSSHMTGNKAYLSDYEDYNGGFVAFGSDPKRGKITGKGKIRTANLDFDDVYFVDELKFNLFFVSQMCDKKNSVLFTETECLILSPSFKLLDESQVVLRAPRKDDVYSLDLKNIVPSGGITCLYANATADESKLWHRRLGHVNFKNINKLVKGHLVRGLPSKVFVNDHTCVACKKGKQHKASCKAKLVRIIRKPLELLHMDLFGPVSVESINKKRYCLVVTDDFSRFSWVFFLATKDETSKILCKFIIGLENQLNHNVKIIRCDNGTEFKNHDMNEFCAKKGIKMEFSVARTPQQNGIAERKNRTLIEAARTVLADSLLRIPFWAETVITACYVLNRVLVTKPQNKIPYELLIVFLDKQLKNVPVPLDHVPINALTSNVFSFMVKKGKRFSGNVTPLFESMLVQPTEDEGEALERQSEPQPTPSPPHPSADQHETQPDPSLRPSPTIPIPDSISEGSGGNHGGQSSSDRSLSGFKDGLTLQSVYDLCMSLCKQSVSIKKRLARKKSLKKKWMQKESVSKQGRKSAKSTPTAHTDQVFDDVDVNDAIDYMETDAYMQKEVSTEDQVSTVKLDKGTDKPAVSTDKLDEGTAEPKDGTSDESTAPIIVFRDDETITEFFVSMSQNKAKQKDVEIKDVEDSDRQRATSTRSVLTLKPLPKINPKDKGKKVLEEEAESDAGSKGVDEAERKFDQLAKDEEIARKARIKADRLLTARLQEEERETFTVEERAKFLYDTIAAQRRFLAQQRLAAIRSRPPIRTQLRNQMMTYLKHVGEKKLDDLKNKNFEEIQVLYKKVKRSDKNFIAIAEDERQIKEMNEESKYPKKKRLKKRVVNETPREEDITKVPAEQEVTE
ncbi:putative ribonuclease H-like domain-containing protein [Tanacetum coccineum]